MSAVLPVPSCVTPPAPPMVLATATASLRSKRRLVPLATVTAPPPSVPALPPLPTVSVPAPMLVAPL